jgi:hypothetical protein
MLPDASSAEAIPGVVKIKSILSEPLLCDGRNGRVLCCFASGSINPHDATRVDRLPLWCRSTIGIPGVYFRGHIVPIVSGL